MIIKSLARKRPGFRQLIGYIGRGGGDGFSRNLYGLNEPHQVATAFERNYALLPKRRNGNALYHEVIVLPPQPGLSKARQAVILQELADRYCAMRAPHNLAYGRIHQDTDNSHIHLMVSANAAQSNIRTRLSRTRFAEIQKAMEREVQRHFPELQDRVVYDRGPSQSHSSKPVREDAMERAGKAKTRKATIRDLFEQALRNSTSEADLRKHLQNAGIDLYQRGKHLGLRDTKTNARYRLTTLGLADQLAPRQRDWLQKRDLAKQAEQAQIPTKTNDDPRAAELHRLRAAQAKRAERMLRDFDPER